VASVVYSAGEGSLFPVAASAKNKEALMSNSLISRRQFTKGVVAAGGLMVFSRRLKAADFELRNFHNQPADSPQHKRLLEMWSAIESETRGRVHTQVLPNNNRTPGSDPEVFRMLVAGEIDFFNLNGGIIGNLVPPVNVQGMPFAFSTQPQVYRALDGDLGDYLRQEMRAKGIYAVPRGCFENGFRQISCSLKPIRTAADLQGLKMRTPNAEIYVECWRALGATTVVANFDQLYETLRTKAADAQDNPLNVVELLKLYEVQKYESLTNHMWSGFNLIANLRKWESLPADIRAVIERNAAKYAALQRADNDGLNNSLRATLERRGMIFNDVDAASFKAMLGGYYARWKQNIGQRTWSLLEGHVGKLG
jgi:tripartite ATP-independent transporter DctP family solute receptor